MNKVIECGKLATIYMYLAYMIDAGVHVKTNP